MSGHGHLRQPVASHALETEIVLFLPSGIYDMLCREHD